MNDELIITVSGKTGSGKSRLSCLLKEFLTAVGFDVTLNLSDGDVEDLLQNNLMSAINQLTDSKTITINEVNIARTARRNCQEVQNQFGGKENVLCKEIR